MVRPLTGQTIARYRLLEPIGEGGMGVVYRAEDPQLSRAVAVKVLAERFALDTAALRRFFDEARAASALSHPHICTVHDAGEHEGRPYLVMELVQGRTLSAMLADGPLSLDAMLPLAIQLADALAAAHAAGIVHCDIKPGNLMVTGHGLKILDFGLAKALLPDTSTLTHPVTTPDEPGRAGGTVMGTVPYMSPEQVRGDAVDARTDVFSCGATLYEMATGRRAFPGDTLELVVDAVLRRSPARVAAGADRGIPDALQGILDKALEKDRTLRYQHISDLKSDLLRLSRDVEAHRADPAAPPARAVGRLARVPRRAFLAAGGAGLAVVAAWIGARGTVAPGGPSVESIAVMPFGNATGDRELEYLTDGLTVRLINTLADVPRLQVKSRAAVFRYKGRTDDPRRLGQGLQVEVQAAGHDLEAIAPLEQARALEPRLSEAIAAAGHAYARAGRVADARAALATLHELSKTQYVSPMDMATVHAGLGEARETLDWLERAYARRSYLMPFIDALPYFDAFDAEPRFQALLARLGLPARSAAARP